MPIVPANGIELYHETFGDPSHPPVLLISGLGAQCTGYDDRLVEALVASGLRVVRYDNRDVGLSTHVEPGDDYGIGDLVGKPSGCSTRCTSTVSTSSARRWAG